MLKSQILDKLHNKYKNLELNDIESIFELFIKNYQTHSKMVKILKLEDLVLSAEKSIERSK